MNSFVPHMEIFLPSQQTVWSSLAPVLKAGFVLYGGTAVALRLGHRQSIDFDFLCYRYIVVALQKFLFVGSFRRYPGWTQFKKEGRFGGEKEEEDWFFTHAAP